MTANQSSEPRTATVDRSSTPAGETDLSTLRRRLHAHPELRFAETQTAAILTAELASVADDIYSGVAGTGIIARITGAAAGPNLLIRADIDAYPVQDTKTVEYRSQNPGVTHACGHDVHAAVGVGVVRHFAARPPALGSVTVVFQPAEEIPFGAVSGAAAMLATNMLGDRVYDAVLGLHCWPQVEAGCIGLESEIAMAAKDAFEIRVLGIAAHAATPAGGRDALLATASMVSDLHAAAARRRDAHEQVAFNVGTIVGGSSQSVLASDVAITGTLRTQNEEVRQRLRGVIEDVVAGTGVQYGVQTVLTWANEMPAVINAPHLVALARDVLASAIPVVDLDPGPMTSDDFALYGALAPTLYLKLGVAPTGAAPGPSLHSSTFDVDERCIDTGVRALTRLCAALISGSNPPRSTSKGHR